MDQKPLTAFTGLKGSGKDTAGAVFTKRNYQKVSFAQPLKKMLRELLIMRGVPNDETDDYLEGFRKEQPTHFLMGKSPRHAMQTIGTEWGRGMIADDLWIDTFERRCFGIRKHYGVVVTDVRFPNEVEAIKKLGGVVFRVNRDSQLEAFLATPPASRHPSEAEVMALDVTDEIQNNFATANEFQSYIAKRFF